MEKNKDYTYKQIERYAEESGCEISEYGTETIGHSFLVLEHPNTAVLISFILTGYNSAEGNIYTCVYSDL